MSAQSTTHIANLISAMRAKPVEIVQRSPSDDDLINTVYLSFFKIRYPDVGEDPSAAMDAAKGATLELNRRIIGLRAELKAEREARRRAIDAFDEQSEELERLRTEMGR